MQGLSCCVNNELSLLHNEPEGGVERGFMEAEVGVNVGAGGPD